MNSYTRHLDPAKAEILRFAASEEGDRWPASSYEQLIDLVEKTQNAPTDEAAERYLDMLLWSIVDSGPLEISPSVDIAAEAMQRKRKRLFRENRKGR